MHAVFHCRKHILNSKHLAGLATPSFVCCNCLEWRCSVTNSVHLQSYICELESQSLHTVRVAFSLSLSLSLSLSTHTHTDTHTHTLQSNTSLSSTIGQDAFPGFSQVNDTWNAHKSHKNVKLHLAIIV